MLYRNESDCNLVSIRKGHAGIFKEANGRNLRKESIIKRIANFDNSIGILLSKSSVKEKTALVAH